MAHTLVLGSDYQPISYLPLSAVHWQQGIKLLFLDKVHVLDWYEDWAIHSQKTAMRVPAVVAMKDGFVKRKLRSFSRMNLYIRDMYQCQYCGDTFQVKDLTIDHVKPKSKGGKTSWENCVAACKTCNHKKGAKPLKPMREPFIPDYYQLAKHIRNIQVHVNHESWSKYLNLKHDPIVVNKR
jgi:5-methylcytosine-specific restriction endonuclease McrA